MIHYFDNAATTPVRPEAVQAAVEAMTQGWGNPSSRYALGSQAAEAVKRHRAQAAAGLGCRPEELFFTSCGTEGDNWAIQGAVELGRRTGKHIITTAYEHAAVLEPCKALERQGYEVTYLQPDRAGNISLDDLEGALRPDTVLVSMMLVNNELGTVLPHKIHAPKGIGALYIRGGLKFPPMIRGGGQESGLRSGTEATAQIAAFAAAVEAGAASLEGDMAHMAALKEETLQRLAAQVPGLKRVGEGTAPHILAVTLPGYKSEVIVRFLSDRGICLSSGSACHKGKPSHVYAALKLPKKELDGVLRISFSYDTTLEDVQALAEGLKRRAFPEKGKGGADPRR